MTHGLPDYYRGVDIAYQALARLMVRPTYGAAECQFGSKTVTPGGNTKLCRIEGKGVIYGGYFFLDHTSDQKNSQPLLEVDDFTISCCSFYNLYCYSLCKPWVAVMYLLRYDDVNHIHSVGVSPNITFESFFEMRYYEAHTSNPKVYYYVFYALIS